MRSRSLLLLLGALLLSSALLEAAAQRDNILKVDVKKGRKLSAPPPRGVRRSPPRGVRTEPSASPSPAPVPVPSPAPSPAAKPSPAPVPQPSPSPAAKSPSPSPAPAPVPSPSPAANTTTRSPSPSPAPAPVLTPTPSPSPSPAAKPSPSPAVSPSPSPSPAPKPSPAPAKPPRVIKSLTVSTGGRFTCVLADGEVKCFGVNDNGQLGLGDTDSRGVEADQLGQALPVVDLGTGAVVSQLTTGTTFSCALLKIGNASAPVIKCWGGNSGGQLGLGDSKNRGDEPGTMGDALTAVDLGAGLVPLYIGAGGLHACALLRQVATGLNVVKCWGSNYAGQLGQEDMVNRGDKPGQMGDNLHPVNLGKGINVTQLAVGGEHNCVLVTDAAGKTQVKCWGSAEMGQVGYGDNTYRGDVNGTMGDALPFVDLGTGLTATHLVAGQYSSCAFLSSSSAPTAAGSIVKCWGSADGGQLGTGDEERRGDAPDEMGDNLPALDMGTDVAILNISLGLGHGCAVLANTSSPTTAQRLVKCWGQNDYGELGYGDLEYRGDAPGEMGDELPAVDLGAGLVTQVSCNSYYSCAVLQLTSGPTLKCWGDNSDGQLGTGDSNARGDEPGEMGSALEPVDITF